MSDQSVENLAEEIRGLDAGDSASLLSTQSPAHIREALAALPPEQAIDIAALLPGVSSREEVDSGALAETLEGGIGKLVEKPRGVLQPMITVAGALDYIVQEQPHQTLTYIYIVDAANYLVGVVAMRDLLLARPGQKLGEIMAPVPFAFDEDASLTEAIQAALVRRHRMYPVTSKDGRLVGVVYGWKLFDRMATEISAQSGSMVGVDKEERVSTPILEAFRKRHPWLQVNLLTAFVAALVVGLFEDTIVRVAALAAFLPVLAGQSGNTGCQALAITLRGITLGELGTTPVRQILRKEIVLGALNGLLVGVVAAAAMWLYATSTGGPSPLILSLVILVAMIGACVGSGIFGVMVPITLQRFGADPALASSIFLTTFTDVLGIGLMLALASTFVP